MPLVNLSEIQKDAQEKQFGIGAPEIWDQFSTKIGLRLLWLYRPFLS